MSRVSVLLFASLLAAAPAQAGRGNRAEGVTIHQVPDVGMLPFGGPKLGVGLTEITPELRAHFGAPGDAGVLVGQVVPDSAAAKAGVEVGDVIVKFGDARIDSTVALRRAVTGEAGTDTTLEVVRDGRSKTLQVHVDPADTSAVGTEWHRFSMSPDGKSWVVVDGNDADLGAVLDRIPDDLRRQLDHPLLDGLQEQLEDLQQQMLELSDRLESEVERVEQKVDELDQGI